MKKERQINDANWDRFGLYVGDCRRLAEPMPLRVATLGAFHYYTEPMNEDQREYRYEERGDEYQLRCWHNGVERTARGLIAHMPEWLRAVLDTAKVAGAVRQINEPPPNAILWFRTDDNNQLIEFVEMK